MKTKSLAQSNDLAAAIELLGRVHRRLMTSGEPTLELKASALLRELIITKDRAHVPPR